MAPKLTHATLEFQTRASALLQASAPATSAHLQASRQAMANEEGVDLAEGCFACSACGSAIILGWTCRTDHGAPRKRTRQDRLKKKSTTKTWRVRCSACSTFNTIESAKPVKRKKIVTGQEKPAISTKPVHTNSADTFPRQPSSAAPITTESGIKKRSRNKKSTLQSMLADRKPAPTTKGFGLDMMDFMKG